MKASIPADLERHPAGCPDADWCRGNRVCYWNCADDGDDDYSEFADLDPEPDSNAALGLLNPMTAPRRVGY